VAIVITKIIEVTNNSMNWGKFLLGHPDTEWDRKAMIEGTPSDRPLLGICGWSRLHLWVLDLQTGEGAFFHIGGNAQADLNNHRIWVCPMFEPFLEWLYAQKQLDITQLPDTLNLPDAPFEMTGYRRPGQEGNQPC
jgi:hypothetical protein